MNSISMICAHQPGRNTGMATVDLAGWNLLRREFPHATVTAYTITSGTGRAYTQGELAIPYRPLHEEAEQAFAADAIIYWGDFLHAPGYWKYDLLPRMVRDGTAPDTAAALELAYRLHFLEQMPEARKRALIFGGTVITNAIAEQTDARYRNAFENLMRDARGIFFRDPISAAHAARFRAGRQTLGADCALLLDDADVPALAGAATARVAGTAGVYFGRSRLTLAMLAFARAVAGRAGLRPAWMPWLGSRWRGALQARALGFAPPEKAAAPADVLAALRGCDIVITDTYHLCVNAWRMGIPAICIGRGAEHSDSTINSKKKEIFYAMHGAGDFYVFQEALRTPVGIRREADRAAALLKSGAGEAVTEAVRWHARWARAQLLECLR
jgi:hypothetical protein